jgi:hypothetical protein
MKETLDRIFFQIFYTIEGIRSVYKDYTHNDLFIRNIMIKRKKYNKDEYIRYIYKKKKYDVPADGICIKINDFGMNMISNKFYKENGIEEKIIKDKYRDYWSIIYDIYDGGNLGGKSLRKIVKNKEKIVNIEKYFSNYIDIKMIKRIIKNNKKQSLDWDWMKTYDEEFVKLVGIKEAEEYMEYYEKIYKYDDKHKIVEEYEI